MFACEFENSSSMFVADLCVRTSATQTSLTLKGIQLKQHFRKNFKELSRYEYWNQEDISIHIYIYFYNSQTYIQIVYDEININFN